MKILLISGHSKQTEGAVSKYMKESEMTREQTGLIQIHLLKKYTGITVDIYDVTKDAFVELGKSQLKIGQYNYVLEVHGNSYNGSAYGTEIFVTSNEKNITVEQSIMNEMKKYFTVRGVKRTNFAVIDYIKNHKKISSALLEVCFIDNSKDMTTYKKYTSEIAEAVATGIGKGFHLTLKNTTTGGSKPKAPKPSPPKSPTSSTKVQTYKFVQSGIRVRTNPDLRDSTLTGAVYNKGNTVLISGLIEGKSYTWGMYYLNDGTKRYVALHDKIKKQAYAVKV